MSDNRIVEKTEMATETVSIGKLKVGPVED